MRNTAARIAPEVERILTNGLGEPEAESKEHTNGSGADEGWPDPLALQSELPPVETMNEELIPGAFRKLVCDVADRMQIPIDYPAAMLVLCLAGAVSRRAKIQPKARDSSWTIVPNLWGGIVAPPGFMKSPIIRTVTRPLTQIQTNWWQQFEAEEREYKRTHEEFELRCAVWKDQYKAGQRNGKAAPKRPENEPEEPKLRRLIVNDTTFQALHQKMSENPAGVLLIRDELTGWWSQLDSPGREGERAFWLEAWNGDTGYITDRIGRGTVRVSACCASMLGGIVPGRLRAYLTEALKDGPGNDGLVQRFQVLVWPDAPRSWRYVDRPPDSHSEERAAKVFESLVSIDAGDPQRYLFAPDALELFIEWLADLEAKVRGDELHPALISHLSKFRSLMPSLALLFELADSAATTNVVSFRHAQQAAAWCSYLESHANRVYAAVTTPQIHAAQQLADKIKQRKVGGEGFFSCRDVYLKCWSGLDTPEFVKQAAEVLEDAHWVRELDIESKPLGGLLFKQIRGQSQGATSMSITRWMEWQPKDRIFSKTASNEPTKPTEPATASGFDGFVGAHPGLFQKIGPDEHALKEARPGSSASDSQKDERERITPFQRSFFSQLAQIGAFSRSDLIELASRRGIPRECAEAFWRSKQRLKHGSPAEPVQNEF